ncbi:unnamed protein product [Orchesella dallaii]|uniref:Chitin-binding type-2 domain-containing protein n=2 Tax=Orchesella dallaii TaxID=48710 RepID=A0ABP1S053_9HEXA
MSLARVFCSWSIAAVLLLLSIAFSSSAESEKTSDTLAANLDENGEPVVNTTSNITLTGNPQIDYVHDPNLPRELNGYNLSDYPFYSRVPKNINFSCDGLKDGFYASIEHKCQIYHHCLFETRYDFLCANYTAFDQRTFICQFVSDVDCPNSHMFFHRNNDLYVTKSTTTLPPVYDHSLYQRRPRPQKKPKSRLRPHADDDGDDTQQQNPTATTAPPSNDPAPPPKRKEVDYADDDYDEDEDYDYVRRPARPRRRLRKCRNGRRRGRRCRGRRPVYDYDDYSYDDDYDYAYYDSARPRKNGKKKRPLNTIPAGTSQVTSTSSSETPPPTTTASSKTTTTTTTTTTTEAPLTTSSEGPSGPLDSESVTVLQNKRDELLAKTRRPSPFLRPGFRPSRQNDKSRTTTSTSTTTSTTTTTERAKPTTTKTTTTTEVPQYIYDYEYYEDDTPVEASSTTTTSTTSKPFLRGKIRGGNSAAAMLEKQRVQQSIQVRVTEDSGTNTNTIRRRDSSGVQTPTRVVTLPPTTSTTTTTTKPSSTPTPNRPSRFWQRRSTVKIVSTTATPKTTTTTAAPYYQDYQDYEDADVVDPQPSVQPHTAPAAPLQQSSKFQPLLNPTHQYGTSPVVSNTNSGSQRQQSYANTGSSSSLSSTSPSQQSASSARGHGSGSSLSSSSYARPAKPYSMQQYSQSSSSSSSSNINNSNSNSNSKNNNNYNTNSYHRQRSPTPSVPKPEFISLVDEDYNNPYVSPVAVAPTSPTSTRLHGGGSQGGGSSGYHQHPIRYFEQQHQPPFLFGAASEYNSPQFAFPPRNYPSPSNFQPYGHSTRRFSAHFV